MCGCNLVTPRLIGGGGRSSAGSLSMFAAIRRAPSRVSSLAAARRPGSSSKERLRSVRYVKSCHCG